MAITQNTLIGRSKQSVGGTTFTTLLGKNVLKSKPVTVANPKTEGQINQRAKLALLVSIFRLNMGAFNVGFKEMAVGMYPYNAFTSTNLKNNSVVASGGVATFNANNFVTSKGTIGSTTINSAVCDHSDQNLVVTWDAASIPVGGSASDKVNILAFNTQQNSWVAGDLSVSRSAGTITLDIPSNWATGNTVSVYLAFSNDMFTKASDSVMVGVSIQG